MRFCPFCGAKLPPQGTAFCTECGRNLSDAPAGEAQDGQAGTMPGHVEELSEDGNTPYGEHETLRLDQQQAVEPFPETDIAGSMGDAAGNSDGRRIHGQDGQRHGSGMQGYGIQPAYYREAAQDLPARTAWPQAGMEWPGRTPGWPGSSYGMYGGNAVQAQHGMGAYAVVQHGYDGRGMYAGEPMYVQGGQAPYAGEPYAAAGRRAAYWDWDGQGFPGDGYFPDGQGSRVRVREQGKKKKSRREKRQQKKLQRKEQEAYGPQLEPYYDGYYEDVLPEDVEGDREGTDWGLVRRVILLVVISLLVVGACVVLMYLL